MPGKDPVESCGFHCHLLWVLRGKELWGKMERNINILSHPTPKYPQFLRKKKRGPRPFSLSQVRIQMSHKKSLLLKILVLFYRDPYFMVFERIPIYITIGIVGSSPAFFFPHQPRGPIQTLGIPDYFKACDTIHFTTFVDGTGNLDSEENNRRMMTDRSPFLGMLQKAQELHFPEIVPEDYFQ